MSESDPNKNAIKFSNGEWVEAPSVPGQSQEQTARMVNSSFKSGRAMQFGPELVNPAHVMVFRFGGKP